MNIRQYTKHLIKNLTKNKLLQNLSTGYRFTAITLLNTIVAFLLMNAILFVFISLKDHFTPNPVTLKYGNSPLTEVYQDQGLNEYEIDSLLKETWTRPYIYQPFTQFKERPYQGLYVNVNDKGFRATKNQGAWPPLQETLNIFLFGGSTTFGYGVPDNQTVASHLQEFLGEKIDDKVRVYNFGQGDYYSVQERILYEELLISGVVPDVAIFIDGLNDFCYVANEPRLTRTFREFVDNSPSKNPEVPLFLKESSLARAMRSISYRFSKLYSKEQKELKESESKVNLTKYADREVLNLVLDRYLKNKRLIEAISTSFNVTPIFVWQPVPNYQYDQRYHLFSEGGYGKHSYTPFGYERMAELRLTDSLGNNFLWCAHIQQTEKKPLYVDKVHYSAGLSRKLAKKITDLIISRSLIADTIAMAN